MEGICRFPKKRFRLVLSTRCCRSATGAGKARSYGDCLAQVRHETGQDWAKPFRISLGSRQVYTTCAVVFEVVWKAQLELMKQGFLLGRGFRNTAQSNLTAVGSRQYDVGALQCGQQRERFHR